MEHLLLNVLLICYLKGYFAKTTLKLVSEVNIYKVLAMFMCFALLTLYFSQNVVSIVFCFIHDKHILRAIDSTHSPRCYVAQVGIDP